MNKIGGYYEYNIIIIYKVTRKDILNASASKNI